jgi:PAS domain S-box-containing protein
MSSLTEDSAAIPRGSARGAGMMPMIGVVALGIALSVAVFALVGRWERERVAQNFTIQARNHFGDVAITVQRYQEALFTLRDVFAASDEVTFAEFRTAAADLRERHPGIQSLAWLPRVSEARRAEIEARAAREVHGDFAIREGPLPAPGADPAAPLPVAAPGREYLPVLYLDPVSGQESAFGYDHFAGPFRDAILRARDEGIVMATPCVRLRAEVPGWLFFLPIYKTGPTPRTAPDRQAAFLGCVLGSFRFADLLAGSIDATARRDAEVFIFDQTPGEPAPFRLRLADQAMRDAPPGVEDSSHSAPQFAKTLAVAGRAWRLVFRPTATWLRTQRTNYAYAFLASGLLLTGLLALGLRSAQRRSAEIGETVALRTAELRRTQRALVEDIHQRVEAERALRASEERYRAFLANSSEAIWRFEFEPPVPIDQPEEAVIAAVFENARLAECNDAVARMYGYERAKEMIGIRLRTIMPEAVPANVEHLREYVRNGFRLEDSESFELDRHGRPHIFLNNVIGIIEDRHLQRAWGTQRDVTDQRRAEAVQRENDARLRLALAAADLGTWEWNTATKTVIVSEFTERIFGLEPGGFRGEADEATARVHPEDRALLATAAEAAFRHGAEYHVEHRILRPDGSIRWVSARGDVIADATGAPTRLIGTIMDVTDQRQRAEEQAAMERKLQESQKLESLGILAGGIAHDFNNLLTGILGNASLARMDLPPTSPVHASLEAIETVAQRAADLCKQMLAYSGKGRFLVQRLDLGNLVRETADLLQISIGKNVVLKFSLAENLPAISADATQISQIIMNLVINASDAIGTAPGVITLGTGVIRADHAYLANTYLSPELSEGDYVYLEISDDGCGMSAETQKRIFDPFFTTKFTGRGLGLAAVLGIVRGHGGALRVYSEVGKGSTFKLLLPAVAGGADARPAAEAAPAAWRTEGTVLVVDDEESVRSVVARMLRSCGCETRHASNGREALEIFRAEPERFIAVLLDLTMPELDGTATFRELRRISPQVRVLLMSGFNEQDAISRFAGKGLAGFLQKPFKPEALFQKLRAILESPAGEETGNLP